MKLKNICYFLVPTLSLFLLIGCGESTSTENEKVAIYIPNKELQAQEKLSKSTNFTLPISKLSTLVKEDAERDNLDEKWFIYDKNPAGSSVAITYDKIKRSRVIEFNSHGLLNGFALGAWTKYGAWSNKTHKIVQWSMRYSEYYYIYIRISTAKGYRYLYYTPEDYNYGTVDYDVPHYIHHGLGTNSTDGLWKTFIRDIEADLKEFDPNNTLISIDGFFVRGSGRIDNVALLGDEDTVLSSIREAISKDPDINSYFDVDTHYAILNHDKKRAIISYYIPHGIGYSRLHILDISDLNQIKILHTLVFGRYTSFYKNVKIKKDDYIMLIRWESLGLYDYTTGERIAFYSFTDYFYNNYLTIKDNYAIIQDNHALKKLNFQEKENFVTTLYEGNYSIQYSLSPDDSSVIVKSGDQYIKEIEIE